MHEDNLSPKHMTSLNQGLSFLTPLGVGEIKDPGNEAAKLQDSSTGRCTFIYSQCIMRKTSHQVIRKESFREPCQ